MQSIKSTNLIIQAIDNKKIREYPKVERNAETSILINYLLALLGINSFENDQKEMHYIVLDDFISGTLLNYTYQEIKIAFKNHVKGDYNIPAFNKLDSIIVGKVMRAYDLDKKYAIDQDRIKRNKEQSKKEKMYISKEEKEHIMKKAIDQGRSDWLEKGILELATSRYDYLDEQGIFQKAFKLTETNWEKVKKRRYVTVREQMRDKLEQNKAKSYMEKVKIKELLKSIETSRNGKVIAECKRSLLIDYYDQSRTPAVDQPKSDMIGKETFI